VVAESYPSSACLHNLLLTFGTPPIAYLPLNHYVVGYRLVHAIIPSTLACPTPSICFLFTHCSLVPRPFVYRMCPWLLAKTRNTRHTSTLALSSWYLRHSITQFIVFFSEVRATRRQQCDVCSLFNIFRNILHMLKLSCTVRISEWLPSMAAVSRWGIGDPCIS
jgi:hypothetical protein